MVRYCRKVRVTPKKLSFIFSFQFLFFSFLFFLFQFCLFSELFLTTRNPPSESANINPVSTVGAAQRDFKAALPPEPLSRSRWTLLYVLRTLRVCHTTFLLQENSVANRFSVTVYTFLSALYWSLSISLEP